MRTIDKPALARNLIVLTLVGAICFFAGTLWQKSRLHIVHPNGAYLVGAAKITDYERLPEYRAIAEPLARRGGYEVIAAANTGSPNATLLEGEWPAEGLLFIERYDSMNGLMEFINSPEFQKAKVMRDQVAEVFFMFALDAGEAGVPH